MIPPESGTPRSRVTGPGIHWRGHVFLFEGRPDPGYEASTGLRLLLIFLVLEGIIGPRFALFHALRLPSPPFWLRVPILLGIALLSVRYLAGLRLAQIGFHRWREWSGVEKSYFLQVLLIANVVFPLLLAGRWRAARADTSPPGWVGVVVLANFLWGFYQEVMYRGILQTELMRRWGSWVAVLAGNSLFTFGPLHFYHFSRTPHPLPMFVAIFAIGLFFAVVFRRSGNLWMVATFHGLGNAYLLGALPSG